MVDLIRSQLRNWNTFPQPTWDEQKYELSIWIIQPLHLFLWLHWKYVRKEIHVSRMFPWHTTCRLLTPACYYYYSVDFVLILGGFADVCFEVRSRDFSGSCVVFMFIAATDEGETVICLKVLCTCRSVIDATHEKKDIQIFWVWMFVIN